MSILFTENFQNYFIEVKIMYERIKELAKERGITINSLESELGFSRGSLSKIDKNKPSVERLIKLADFFKVQVDYLTGDSQYRTKSEWLNELDNKVDINKIREDMLLERYGLQPIDIHKIPLLGSVACGEPIFASEDRELYVEVGTNIKADYCLTAKGDSMINARINDGDIVFIQRTDSINNGEIGVVLIDNDVTLKRIYYYPNDNKLVLQAENSKYEPMVYLNNELDKIRIIGKAIAFQSDIM